MKQSLFSTTLLTLKAHRTAALILVGYLILATAYNLANPLFESPDELLHYQFVQTLQAERRLPVVNLEGPLTEYHQPPLYYVITAVLSRRVSEPPLPRYTTVNPFWGYEIGWVGDDNKNQFLHPLEAFPYSPRRRSVHAMRFISTLFGTGTILLTYLLARRFTSARFAAVSMAIVAFTPNFLLTSGSVTNDSLIIMLSAAAALMLVDLTASDEPPPVHLWTGLAVLMGLGMLAKLSFWPLLPASATAVGLLARRLKSWRVFFIAGAILLAGVAVISGWWVVRNYRLYGDLTGLSSMWSVWGVRPPLTAQDYLIELRNFRTTFWGNFGYGNVPLPGWIYTVLDLFALGGTVGLGLKLLQGQQTSTPRARRDQVIVLIVWSVLTFSALVWYLQKTFSVTGRQLYPIFPVLALGLVVGWAALIPVRLRHWAGVILVAGMAALASGALLRVLIPAYRPSPRLSSAEVERAVTQPLGWQVGDVATLLGYHIDAEAVQAGGEAVVTLYWLPEKTTTTNYTEFVHIYGVKGTQIGARDTYPGLGNDPTIYWQPGEVIVDQIPVPVASDAQGPILAEIEVGLYELETGERLPVLDAAGNPLGYPLIGTIKVEDSEEETEPPPETLEAVFEGGQQLTGYMVPDISPAPEGTLELTLYWQSAGPLPASYKVFVHLIDPEEQIAAQADGIPREGRYPTTAWGVGETFTDPYTIQLAGVIPGTYYLRIGLYDPVTTARLRLSTGEDHVDLPTAIMIR